MDSRRRRSPVHSGIAIVEAAPAYSGHPHGGHDYYAPAPADFYPPTLQHYPTYPAGHSQYPPAPAPQYAPEYHSPDPVYHSPAPEKYHTAPRGRSPRHSPKPVYHEPVYHEPVYHSPAPQYSTASGRHHSPGPPPNHPCTDRINAWRASVTPEPPEPPRARDEYGSYTPGLESDLDSESEYDVVSDVALPVANDYVHITPVCAPPAPRHVPPPPQLRSYNTAPAHLESPREFYERRPRRPSYELRTSEPTRRHSPRRVPKCRHYDDEYSDDERPVRRRSGKDRIATQIDGIADTLDRVLGDKYALEALSRQGLSVPKLAS